MLRSPVNPPLAANQGQCRLRSPTYPYEMFEIPALKLMSSNLETRSKAHLLWSSPFTLYLDRCALNLTQYFYFIKNCASNALSYHHRASSTRGERLLLYSV